MEGVGSTMGTSFSKQYEVGGYYSTWTDLTVSSTAFTDLGTFDCKAFKTKTIVLTATSTDLAYKVLGSIDGGSNYDIVEKSSASLTASNSTAFQVTNLYTNIKVQGAYASTTGTGGTLSGKYFGVTL